MKKKVWLVSHYAMPPHLEPRPKTIKFAENLQSRGYEVLLVTASTIHNTDENLIVGKEKFIEKTYGQLKYVHLKCNNYKGSGIKRVFNLIQFQRRFCTVMKKFEKPDIIVCDCNCINYFGILHFARKYKIKFVSEIRDLWPLSIVEYLGISNKNPVIKALYVQEKRMYRLSDAIIFSMEGGKDYIMDKGWDKSIDLNKIFNINNGVDIELQQIQKQQYSLIDDEDLNFDGFKVVYVGSIRKVNYLMLLVKCAELLKDKEDIRFIIYGDGNERENLVKYCEEKGLSNIIFKGFVDKKYIPYILSKADLNIINVQQTNIMKYGCSLNKLFDYMASGKPILSNLKVGYDLLEKYKCGITTEDQTPEKMADGILYFYNMDNAEYEKMCKNARAAAEDFDYKVLTDKLEGVIEYALSKE